MNSTMVMKAAVMLPTAVPTLALVSGRDRRVGQRYVWLSQMPRCFRNFELCD